MNVLLSAHVCDGKWRSFYECIVCLHMYVMVNGGVVIIYMTLINR